MTYPDVLAEPMTFPLRQPRGRLVLQTLVPTDRRSAGARAAFSIALELAPDDEGRDMLPRLLSSLLFTLVEDLVGVVADVAIRPSSRPAASASFATDDTESLRAIIAEHWRDDQRMQFSVYPLTIFRQVIGALRPGSSLNTSQAVLHVVQNRTRSGLVLRGPSLNAFRARIQVERLCTQYGLDLVL